MKPSISPSAHICNRVSFLGSAFVGENCVLGEPGFQHRDWSAEDFSNTVRKETVIGNNARILSHSVICQGAEIGNDFRCDTHSYIGESARLGCSVVVEYGARIYDRSIIGKNTTVGGFICNDATIGESCSVQGSLVHKRTSSTVEAAPIIENNCLIGTGAVVVGAIRVAEGTILAAGAVLLESTEPGYLYAGVPAIRLGMQVWY